MESSALGRLAVVSSGKRYSALPTTARRQDLKRCRHCRRVVHYWGPCLYGGNASDGWKVVAAVCVGRHGRFTEDDVAIARKPPCDEGVIRSGKREPGIDQVTGRWVLLATILGSSMAFIDSTVVTVALPTLQREFSATAAAVQWVVQALALLLASLILVGGSLGDRLGRRRIFVIGTVLFTLASVWCGAAPNLEQLIAARVLQGVGGADGSLQPLPVANVHVPFNLIQVQNYSSTQAGAALLPLVLMLFGLSRWAGSLIDRLARDCR